MFFDCTTAPSSRQLQALLFPPDEQDFLFPVINKRDKVEGMNRDSTA